MGRFNRWRFVTEAQNSRPVWALGILWAFLSVLATLSFLFPKISNFAPQLPWYAWAMSGLVIIIVALFEGAYRQANILWSLTDWKHRNLLAQEMASVLLTRKLYYQHFNLEVKDAVLGFCWEAHLRFLFLRLILSSREVVGINSLRISVETITRHCDCVLTNDLSEWVLRTEVPMDRYPYKNISEVPLDSIWSKLEAITLRPGEPVTGWACFEVPEEDNYSLESIKLLRLQVEDTLGRTQYEYCYHLPVQQEARIVHIDLRRLRQSS